VVRIEKRADNLAEFIEHYVEEWCKGDSGQDFSLVESCYAVLCDVADRDCKNLKEISDLYEGPQ